MTPPYVLRTGLSDRSTSDRESRPASANATDRDTPPTQLEPVRKFRQTVMRRNVIRDQGADTPFRAAANVPQRTAVKQETAAKSVRKVKRNRQISGNLREAISTCITDRSK